MKKIQLSDIDEIVNQISQAKTETENNLIIAVSGGSATGKTSQVSKVLKDKLIGLGFDSGILSQDNFQFGKAFVDQFENREFGTLDQDEKVLFDNIRKYKWDIPENYDSKSCETALSKIKSGEDVISIPNFQVKQSAREGSVDFKVPNITIFEGLYTYFDDLSDFKYDLKIYVETPFYARFLRRYFRFVYEMQIPHPEKALKQITTKVLSAHKDFVETQKTHADYIIEIPYDFAKTIETLNLSPKADIDYSDLDVILEYEFQVGGKIYVFSKNDEYRFVVFYNGKVWENIEISSELKDSIFKAFNI